MADPATIDRNAPLRLARAVQLAYPEGGMTVSGLRREIARGRLEVERTAGKDFVTLASIERMREQCRVQSSPRDSGSARPVMAARPSTSSSMVDLSVARASALKIAQKLRKPLQGTSATSTTQRSPAADGPSRFP